MRFDDCPKPIQRSRLRVYLGQRFFTFKRHVQWMTGGYRFAAQQPNMRLAYCIAAHETPLVRQLRNVDMWLQTNKVTNLKLAVSKLNSVVLQPGETFSYWRTIGKPTKGKGYVEGMVLYCGSFGPGVGGGLCQLSNLIYWMTIHTPLTVIERHRHSFDVFPDSNRTQPFGSGATCSYNYLDLMIRNDTEQPFQLLLEVTDSTLKGRWCSDRPTAFRYEVFEKEHRFEREYWGGYSRHNTLYRRVIDACDNVVDEEYITENHALMMYQPFLEQGAR